MKLHGNMVLGRRPVSLREAYSDDQIVEHIANAEVRIAELEAALRQLRDDIHGGFYQTALELIDHKLKKAIG